MKDFLSRSTQEYNHVACARLLDAFCGLVRVFLVKTITWNGEFKNTLNVLLSVAVRAPHDVSLEPMPTPPASFYFCNCTASIPHANRGIHTPAIPRPSTVAMALIPICLSLCVFSLFLACASNMSRCATLCAATCRLCYLSTMLAGFVSCRVPYTSFEGLIYRSHELRGAHHPHKSSLSFQSFSSALEGVWVACAMERKHNSDPGVYLYLLVETCRL